jgi:hypothetical protein
MRSLDLTSKNIIYPSNTLTLDGARSTGREEIIELNGKPANKSEHDRWRFTYLAAYAKTSA